MRTTINRTCAGAADRCSARPPPHRRDDKIKLAIGQRGNWDTSVSEVGQLAGIFKKHGLELEIVYTQGAGETQQAVISGSVDIGIAAGVMGVLSAYSKGAPVRVIGAETTGANDLYWYVKADSPIKSLKDTDDKITRLFDQRFVDARHRHRLHEAIRAEGQADRDGRPGRESDGGDVGPDRCRLGGAAVRPRSARRRSRSASSRPATTPRRSRARRCGSTSPMPTILQDAQGRGRPLHEGLPRDGQLSCTPIRTR